MTCGLSRFYGKKKDDIYIRSRVHNGYMIEECDKCGHKMKKLNTCHLICPNCGSHLDCSDKGSVW